MCLSELFTHMSYYINSLDLLLTFEIQSGEYNSRIDTNRVKELRFLKMTSVRNIRDMDMSQAITGGLIAIAIVS